MKTFNLSLLCAALLCLAGCVGTGAGRMEGETRDAAYRSGNQVQKQDTIFVRPPAPRPHRFPR